VYGPLLLLSGHEFLDTYPQLTGKYAVRHVQFNGQPLMARSCQDNVLTTVYLDIDHDCVFEFSDTKRRLFSTSTYEACRQQLRVVWRSPAPRHAQDNAHTRKPAGREAPWQAGSGLYPG
jgi:hypothetical protein